MYQSFIQNVPGVKHFLRKTKLLQIAETFVSIHVEKSLCQISVKIWKFNNYLIDGGPTLMLPTFLNVALNKDSQHGK